MRWTHPSWYTSSDLPSELSPSGRRNPSTPNLDSSTINAITSQIPLLDIEVQTRAKEIAKVQSVLQCLEQEYVQTVAVLHRKTSLLSPIRRLPSDILLEIFSLAADDSEICLSSPPFILRSVCYTWRVLVLTSPSLWSKVKIKISNTRDVREAYNKQRLLRTAFSLSGKCPLNISIKSFGIIPDTRELTLIQQCLVPTSDRWKSLYLHIQYPENIIRFFDISGRFRMLESLDLTFLDHQPTPQRFYEGLSKLFCSTPVLRTVRISEISDYVFCKLSLPLHQLTSLDVDLEHYCTSGPPFPFYNCIARGTELESFTLRMFHNSSSTQQLSGPFPEIIRPNVRRFSLTYHIPTTLKYCTFPGLEQVTLFTSFADRESAPIIPTHELAVVFEFLKRSNSRLRSLAVYRPIPFPAFNNFAKEVFPSLTDLVISVNEETSTEVIQRLADPSFIPCLRHLSLHICLPVISLFKDNSLISMAISRHNYRLKSLDLSILSAGCLKYRGSSTMLDWPKHLLQAYKLKEAGLGVTFLRAGRNLFADEDTLNELTTWLKDWNAPQSMFNLQNM
ncbi:uncharacterized protein EV420DRAFT_1645105 [Desarmillaria tabescens]|uniref:F-box domain-containing protein n=1 Tax=Armillaria tabescens TaxID=1929756 RepID=A0AA39K6G0_ARMTA|nr:uncharacterized protein EV420DRAFT_1645105 [Desarmillaria tabescens]KAK0454211.1 hypothetical protein EV420DRAFT_1645105 [Desarmillaria tabescens]